MHPFLIQNDADLERAVAMIEDLWDARPGTPEGHLLAVMSTLVDRYEAERSSLPPGDPIELVSFKIRELGWSQRELARRLGWRSGRVSEVLNRKRRLTLAMVQQLAAVLEIPPGLLVPNEDVDEGAPFWIALPPDIPRTLRASHLVRGASLEETVIGIL